MNNIKLNLKESKRAKRLRIVVNCDASVSVIHPIGLNKKIIHNFVAEKQDWILKNIEKVKKRKKLVPENNLSQSSFHACNFRAKKLVLDRVRYFCGLHSFEYNKICIRKQTTRWGSCSSKKNLNFNYKLLFLPIELVDYIVVHELCHLIEMNHSKKFWKLVENIIPDYKDRRKKLKQFYL
jgi:predicted metal-dependent hydrolase